MGSSSCGGKVRPPSSGSFLHEEYCNCCCYLDALPDLPANVTVTGGGRFAPHPLDVVCICKRWAADQAPCQSPNLVIPYQRIDRLRDLPCAVRPRNPPKHPLRWLELASSLLNIIGSDSAGRTSRYLIDLALGRVGLGEAPQPMPLHSQGRPEADLRVLAALNAPVLAVQLLPAAQFRVRIRG